MPPMSRNPLEDRDINVILSNIKRKKSQLKNDIDLTYNNNLVDATKNEQSPSKDVAPDINARKQQEIQSYINFISHSKIYIDSTYPNATTFNSRKLEILKKAFLTVGATISPFFNKDCNLIISAREFIKRKSPSDPSPYPVHDIFYHLDGIEKRVWSSSKSVKILKHIGIIPRSRTSTAAKSTIGAAAPTTIKDASNTSICQFENTTSGSNLNHSDRFAITDKNNQRQKINGKRVLVNSGYNNIHARTNLKNLLLQEKRSQGLKNINYFHDWFLYTYDLRKKYRAIVLREWKKSKKKSHSRKKNHERTHQDNEHNEEFKDEDETENSEYDSEDEGIPINCSSKLVYPQLYPNVRGRSMFSRSHDTKEDIRRWKFRKNLFYNNCKSSTPTSSNSNNHDDDTGRKQRDYLRMCCRIDDNVNAIIEDDRNTIFAIIERSMTTSECQKENNEETEQQGVTDENSADTTTNVNDEEENIGIVNNSTTSSPIRITNDNIESTNIPAKKAGKEEETAAEEIDNNYMLLPFNNDADKTNINNIANQAASGILSNINSSNVASLSTNIGNLMNANPGDLINENKRIRSMKRKLIDMEFHPHKSSNNTQNKKSRMSVVAGNRNIKNNDSTNEGSLLKNSASVNINNDIKKTNSVVPKKKDGMNLKNAAGNGTKNINNSTAIATKPPLVAPNTNVAGKHLERCENCNVYFSDFQKHLTMERHRRYATNDRNFVMIDEFINMLRSEESGGNK